MDQVTTAVTSSEMAPHESLPFVTALGSPISKLKNCLAKSEPARLRQVSLDNADAHVRARKVGDSATKRTLKRQMADSFALLTMCRTKSGISQAADLVVSKVTPYRPWR